MLSIRIRNADARTIENTPCPELNYNPFMSETRPEFLNLSVDERIRLVEDIWDSIAAERPESVTLAPWQIQELEARIAEHDRDPASAVSWEVLREELFNPGR